jgi:hypothetical protein
MSFFLTKLKKTITKAYQLLHELYGKYTLLRVCNFECHDIRVYNKVGKTANIVLEIIKNQ